MKKRTSSCILIDTFAIGMLQYWLSADILLRKHLEDVTEIILTVIVLIKQVSCVKRNSQEACQTTLARSAELSGLDELIFRWNLKKKMAVLYKTVVPKWQSTVQPPCRKEDTQLWNRSPPQVLQKSHSSLQSTATISSGRNSHPEERTCWKGHRLTMKDGC